MSRFLDHLGLELAEDASGRPITRAGRSTWVLTAPLHYDVGAEGSGEVITVPVGAPTDLASIPWPARGLLPPDGPWAKAAVLHDFLYWTGGRCAFAGRNYRSDRPPYTRKEADGILLEAMGVLEVPALKRQAIYRAVRLFGGKGWGS